MIHIHQTQWVAEALALALTVPTVILSAGVLYRWGPPAVKAIKAKTLDAQGWFLVGVAIAFAGFILDSLYWVLPYTASFLGADSAETLHHSGIYFSLFFRQAAGMLAAYCHLKAADMSETNGGKTANKLLSLSYVTAVVLVSCLGVIKLW
jgi:hypothetical protein